MKPQVAAIPLSSSKLKASEQQQAQTHKTLEPMHLQPVLLYAEVEENLARVVACTGSVSEVLYGDVLGNVELLGLLEMTVPVWSVHSDHRNPRIWMCTAQQRPIFRKHPCGWLRPLSLPRNKYLSLMILMRGIDPFLWCRLTVQHE